MNEEDAALFHQFSKPRRASSRRRAVAAVSSSSSSSSNMFHVGANAAKHPPPGYEMNHIASIACFLVSCGLLQDELVPTPDRIELMARRAFAPPPPPTEPIVVVEDKKPPKTKHARVCN